MQVPASLLTRRRLVAGAPQDPAAEAALVKIAETCDEMKQYRQAAAAYTELGTRFPGAKLDGWFRAGELLERRLDAPAEALTAYLKVPPTSPRYHDAQERARRLGRR